MSNLRFCIMWVTERPYCQRSRDSSAFRMLGDEWFLRISMFETFDRKSVYTCYINLYPRGNIRNLKTPSYIDATCIVLAGDNFLKSSYNDYRTFQGHCVRLCEFHYNPIQSNGETSDTWTIICSLSYKEDLKLQINNESNMFAAVTLVVAMATTMVYCCPPSEDLAPYCSCSLISGESMMSCSGVLSPDDLVAPMWSASTRGTRIYSIEIRDSSLQYIPHDVFKGTGIKKVRFVNSDIFSLSDRDIAFSGLEDTLVEIQATDAEYIASWNWQQLRNHQNLEVIDVEKIKMGAVDEPFPRLPRLTALGITKAGISNVVEKAFVGLPGLRTLTLDHNEIKELKRNILPDPADRLVFLDLSDNKISFLPADFLSGMPSLEFVHLDNNQFVTLPENLFSQAFQKLNELSLNGNPIRCDCRLRWLTDKSVPSHFIATCATPESLRGLRISYLEVKHLWC